MSTYIPYTVRTSVTYGGRGLAAASFENAVFVSHHNLYAERVKAFSSVDTMLSAGFAAGSPAVNWATAVFAGRKAPTNIYVGRGAVDAYTVQVDPSVVTDDIIKLNMNLDGTASTFSYTVTGSEADIEEIANALGTLVAADAGITSGVSDGNGLITLVAAAPTTPISFGANAFTTVLVTTSEAPAITMAAIRAENDNFAVVCAEAHDKATQTQYATYVNALPALYVYSTSDVDVYNPVETADIFSVTQGAQYQYVEGTFSERADIEFPEGAVIGAFLSQTPSTIFTMNLQDLVGITPSNLTATQKEAIITKNGNFYELEYGAGSYKAGLVSNGDFLDRSRFGLFLKLRSQESMYGTLKKYADLSSAVSYSDGGITIVKSNLYTDVINVCIAGGTVLTGLSQDTAGKTVSYAPIVDTATRASQTNAAIGQRKWEGFTIEVVYAGSIHHIDTNAFVLNNRTAI